MVNPARLTSDNSPMEQWVNKIWYGKGAWRWPLIGLLLPLSALFVCLSSIRRWAYRLKLLTAHQPNLPVIVVGNITVGGAGKTPTVIWLCDTLKAAGYRPGVVSRGYGRQTDELISVKPDSRPQDCGDEPLLIYRRTQCPVVVSKTRSAAADHLCSQYDVDVVICDDGLQHYALDRDIEIAVVDGSRRLGNGWRLPAGPLRESVDRLQTVDLTVVNGGSADEDEYLMRMRVSPLQPVFSSNETALQEEGSIQKRQGSELASLAGQTVHAVAGIGNPQRFFDLLRAEGIKVIEHALPDHHAFLATDLAFDDPHPIIMTEKDAVKCLDFDSSSLVKKCWYLPVSAELPQTASEQILSLLNKQSQAIGKS